MFFTFVAGYDLDSTSIQITPETFAPDRLCSCSPGWIPSCLRLIGCDQKIRDVSLTSGSFPQLHPNCNSHKTASLLTATWPRKGSGAKCEKCPENSFAENYDSKEWNNVRRAARHLQVPFPTAAAFATSEFWTIEPDSGLFVQLGSLFGATACSQISFQPR